MFRDIPSSELPWVTEKQVPINMKINISIPMLKRSRVPMEMQAETPTKIKCSKRGFTTTIQMT